jgi:hypothetical protein
MRRLATLLSSAILASGCAAEQGLSPSLISEATPKWWSSATALDFKVSDKKGKVLGSFRIALTKEPARTCLGGTWLKATPISSDLADPDLSAWWRDESLWPAYEVSGRRLDVELNGGGLCDDYISVLAELRESGGEGFLEASGLGGSTWLGSVAVVVVEPAAPPNTSLERSRGR